MKTELAKRFGPAAERRVVSASRLRTEDQDGRPARIVGYAAVFNSRSVDLGGFVEVIDEGAFGPALAKNPDVRALVNHDANQVLGRTKSGTLRVSADSVGLRIVAELPDTQAARDLIASMDRGDIDQMSFAFDLAAADGDRWESRGDGSYIRHIVKVGNLYDVSVVTYPAYPDTSVALRKLEAVKRGERKATPRRTGGDTAVRARLAKAVADRDAARMRRYRQEVAAYEAMRRRDSGARRCRLDAARAQADIYAAEAAAARYLAKYGSTTK